MAIVKPFRGLRPPKNLVEKVSCLPYDVMNSEEAAQMEAEQAGEQDGDPEEKDEEEADDTWEIIEE